MVPTVAGDEVTGGVVIVVTVVEVVVVGFTVVDVVVVVEAMVVEIASGIITPFPTLTPEEEEHPNPDNPARVRSARVMVSLSRIWSSFGVGPPCGG